MLIVKEPQNRPWHLPLDFISTLNHRIRNILAAREMVVVVDKIVGSWSSPDDWVLSECVLLAGTSMARIPEPQTSGRIAKSSTCSEAQSFDKAFLGGPSASLGSGCRKCSPWFLFREIYQVKTALLKRWFLQSLAKSAFLILLYTINPAPLFTCI